MTFKPPATVSFQDLSKRYFVPHLHRRLSRTSLAADLASRLARLFRPLDLQGDEVWALREVTFSAAEGEVLGIVGRNGAGKSTLLKILTRITEPTSGRVEVRGRVTSLLEVGTGFHPDLSGRDNVFLNGAILGMETAAIRRRFDTIVAFAGVERFLDLPLKRWSSGMALRLAFSVAAHLDHRVLVVDEALSVGDAAFRAQCLARIEEAARDEGRTVLFVSHDLAQIRRLATRSVLLDVGRLVMDGPTDAVLERYLRTLASDGPAARTGRHLTAVRLLDGTNAPIPSIPSGARCTLELEHDLAEPALLELHLETIFGVRLATLVREVEGRCTRLDFAALTLGPGSHRLALVLRTRSGRELERLPEALTFVVTPSAGPTTEGLVALPLER